MALTRRSRQQREERSNARDDGNRSTCTVRAARLAQVASRACIVLSVLCGTACTDTRRPPPAPHVDLTQPVALIPADVDLVLRLDVRRFRDVMGDEYANALRNLWRGLVLDVTTGEPNQEWLVRTAKDTDTIWLGCRLSPRGCRDYVVVLRGNYVGEHQAYGFGPDKDRRDLGGGWTSYDARAETVERSFNARAYFRAPELIVLVSSAELDSAERSIETGAGATDLVPKETGMVSVLARSHSLAEMVRVRSHKAADWLDGSKLVEIGVEPQTEQTLLTFAVTFSDASEAQRAAQAIKVLTDSLVKFDRRIEPDDLDVQQLETDVVLRVRVKQAVPSG